MTERGELCRILYMGEMTMEKVYDKCCGIDVHKKLIVACLLCGRKSEVLWRNVPCHRSDLCIDLFRENKPAENRMRALVSAVSPVWQLCSNAECAYQAEALRSYPLCLSDGWSTVNCRPTDSNSGLTASAVS